MKQLMLLAIRILCPILSHAQYANGRDRNNLLGHKTGKAIEAAGYIGLIVGGITAVIFNGGMKRIQNIAGQTIATIGYGATLSGVGLKYRF